MAVFRRLIGAGAGGVPNHGAGSKLGIGLMLLYYTTPRDRHQLSAQQQLWGLRLGMRC